MPDVHLGKGATVGSVIATKQAVIPAAVGVDIGCGMIARRLSLKADQLPDDLKGIRQGIEDVIPLGSGAAEVMANQRDLVEVLYRLRQIVNVKG